MDNILITENDGIILRDLAKRVWELAARPREDEKRKLWYKHNSLLETRPLIFFDPENGWNEIIKKQDLKCEGALSREWELRLRREIFCGEKMCDDKVIEPFFNINYVSYEGSWGMDIVYSKIKEGGSYVWDAPLKDYSDFEKLKFPELMVDFDQTQKIYNLAKEVLGDILEVKLKGYWWWTLGITQEFVHLRGLEQMMYDVYDYPDEFHKLMSFLSNGFMKRLDYLQENSLLSINNDSAYVGSGGFGYTNELPNTDFNPAKVRTIDMWGFAESQETVNFSPDMFEEFVFPYQLPLLERFGLNCYGCCEPLNKRWKIIEKIPRLRRVSVSPWADLEDMAEKLENKYIYSMKPIPTDVAIANMDKELVRKKLRDAIRKTRGCRVEIIMKDTNTIGNNPQNVIDWCKIAREEVESI